MAKKLYAVTNVKLGPDREYKAGQEIDKGDFSDDRETLAQLAEAGAVEVREEGEVMAEKPTANAPEDDTSGLVVGQTSENLPPNTDNNQSDEVVTSAPQSTEAPTPQSDKDAELSKDK